MARNKYLEAYRQKKIGTRPPQQSSGSRDKPAADPPKAEKPAEKPATPAAEKPAAHDKPKKPATPPADAPTKG